MSAHQKIEVVVNGKPFLVELGSISGPQIIATVNGKVYEVEVDLMSSDPDPLGAAVPTADHRPKREESGPPSRSTIGAVTAPMPGNITEVNVNEGDVIAKDNVLCSLEAMKMQNAIRSPRAGTIATVAVTAGQAVAYGDILFTFR